MLAWQTLSPLGHLPGPKDVLYPHREAQLILWHSRLSNPSLVSGRGILITLDLVSGDRQSDFRVTVNHLDELVKKDHGAKRVRILSIIYINQ